MVTRIISTTFAVLALLSPAGAPLLAQQPSSTRGAPSAIGTWRGTSRCLVQPSACRDEHVVYRITPVNAHDSVSIDARKIVNGQEEEMGALGCRFVPATGTLTCGMPNGTWNFVVRADSLTGELRLPSGTKFRDVRTARSH